MILAEINLDQVLPQKYPFRMIDKIIEFKKDESLTAVKNITGNEWVFEGQAFKNDFFPETLLMEAAAQSTLCLYQLSKNKENKKIKFILGKVFSEWENFALIGDELKIKAYATKMMGQFGYMNVDLMTSLRIGKVEIMYSIVRYD